jgi:hypothetical protein
LSGDGDVVEVEPVHRRLLAPRPVADLGVVGRERRLEALEELDGDRVLLLVGRELPGEVDGRLVGPDLVVGRDERHVGHHVAVDGALQLVEREHRPFERRVMEDPRHVQALLELGEDGFVLRGEVVFQDLQFFFEVCAGRHDTSCVNGPKAPQGRRDDAERAPMVQAQHICVPTVEGHG